MNPVDKILGNVPFASLKPLKPLKSLKRLKRFDVSKNNEIHNVYYKKDYGWAKFCDCGRDSFVCQHCGQAKCVTQLSNIPINDKNTCVQCYNKRVTHNQPKLKGNPAYDLMM